MAIYNVLKIKNWNDDFLSCQQSFSSIYEKFNNSYISKCSDSTVGTMRRTLNNYYSKIENAYAKINNVWKDFYNDVINADSALAGAIKGGIKSSTTVSILNKMPLLKEFKNELSLGDIIKNNNVNTNVDGINYSIDDLNSYLQSNYDTSLSNIIKNELIDWVSSEVDSPNNINENQTISNTNVDLTNAVEVFDSIKGIYGEKLGAILTTLIIGKAVTGGVYNPLTMLKRAGATIATGGISVAEGVGKFGEGIVDTGSMIVSAIATPFTAIWDGIKSLNRRIECFFSGEKYEPRGFETTKKMWDHTRSFVSKDHVGSFFDKFYDNNSVGKWLKNNAYGFDVTRSIGCGVGEVLGAIALAAATMGIGNAALGAVGAGQIASTVTLAGTTMSTTTAIGAAAYGASKIGSHTQTNWQDESTSTVGGLVKGTIQGVLDGTFFLVGGYGDAVAHNAAKVAAEQGAKKTLSILSKKVLFEAGTSIVQDFGTILTDAAFADDSVILSDGTVKEFDNFGDKIKYYYEKSGGFKGLMQSVGIASILSFASDGLELKNIARNTSVIDDAVDNVKSTVDDTVKNTKIKTSGLKDKIASVKTYTTDGIQKVKTTISDIKVNALNKLGVKANNVVVFTSDLFEMGKARAMKMFNAFDNLKQKISVSSKQVADASASSYVGVTDHEIYREAMHDLDGGNISSSNIKNATNQTVDSVSANLNDLRKRFYARTPEFMEKLEIFDDVFNKMKDAEGEKTALKRLKMAANGTSSTITRKDGLRQLFDSLTNDEKNIFYMMQTNKNLRYVGEVTKRFGSRSSIENINMHSLFDTEGKFTINLQKGYNYKNNSYGLKVQDVIDAYENIKSKNEIYTKNVREINITDIANPDDPYWAIQNKTSEFHSLATGGSGQVNVYKYSSPSDIENEVLIHEFGHNMDLANGRTFGISDSKEWDDAFKNDGGRSVSNYGQQSLNRDSNIYAEDFAETIKLLYNNGGDWLIKKYPNRANILKSFFPELF